MPIEPRDERFIEFAVSSGKLDVAGAKRLFDARQASATTDTIEQFVVRHGFFDPPTVQAIIQFARVSVTQVESIQLPPPPASQSSTYVGEPQTYVGEPQTYVGAAPQSMTYADVSQSQSLTYGGAMHSQSASSGGESTVKDDPLSRGAVSRLGARFGSYEILGELGRGGMGAVYRARKDGTQDVVALKVLSDEKDPNEATTRRFDREIRAGREIDHPNVVRVFDAGEVGGRLFFTMELIDGRSMEKVLEELALRQKIELFEKIARAVHQAHTRGYIHRDLKPQNIMITKELEPKVCDFGLAKSLDRESRLTKTGAILGTIAYMSPEQAEGGGMHKLDARTDIYALGAILYQLICGTVPFKAATQYGTIGLILTTDPDPPTSVDPKCPPGLSAIALKSLEKEREKRFQTAADLADEVGRWLHGTKVTTAAPSLGGKLAKGVKRRRLPLAALLLTFGVAATTIAVLAWKRQRDRRALVGETTLKLDALLAEVAKPGATAELADRLEALEAQLTGLPELAERQRAVAGLALVARSLEREKRPEEARPLVEAALAVAPARWDVRRALVNVLERQGEHALAARCVEEAPEKGAEALERLGLARLEMGDLVAARTAFEAAGEPAKAHLVRALALAWDPKAYELAKTLSVSDDHALLVQEARLVVDAGYAIDALRLLERAKKTPELQVRIARSLLRIERGYEALCNLRRARAAKVSELELLPLEAEGQLIEGRAAEAAKTLEEAAKLAPRGSFVRARLLARRARIQRLAGLEVTREALAERPDDPFVRVVFAGDDPALLEKLAAELGTHPEAVRAWCALARLREKKGDAEGARAARDKARAIAPADEEVLAGDPAKGRLAFENGHGDGARLFRASVLSWRVFKSSWGREDDRARAEGLLAAAERAAPWAGALQVERGRRLLLQGDSGKLAAKEALERGLALTPDEPTGLVLLAGLVEAKLSEELATRALAVQPGDPTAPGPTVALAARALALRGKARLDQKRPQEALADLDKSIGLEKHDADAWEWKVAALEALGKPSEVARREAKDRRENVRAAQIAVARKDWPRAYDLAPENAETVKHLIDASFRGDVSGIDEDPVLLYSRIIALDPVLYLKGIFDREAAEALQPTLADSHAVPEASAEELFEAFVLRSVGIVKMRDSHADTLGKARLDLERCLTKDPSMFCALGARAFILALEKQTDLADDDLRRIDPYIPHKVNVFIFAEALVKAQRGQPYGDQIAILKGNHSDRITLGEWATELTKGLK